MHCADDAAGQAVEPGDERVRGHQDRGGGEVEPEPVGPDGHDWDGPGCRENPRGGGGQRCDPDSSLHDS